MSPGGSERPNPKRVPGEVAIELTHAVVNRDAEERCCLYLVGWSGGQLKLLDAVSSAFPSLIINAEIAGRREAWGVRREIGAYAYSSPKGERIFGGSNPVSGDFPSGFPSADQLPPVIDVAASVAEVFAWAETVAQMPGETKATSLPPIASFLVVPQAEAVAPR